MNERRSNSFLIQGSGLRSSNDSWSRQNWITYPYGPRYTPQPGSNEISNILHSLQNTVRGTHRRSHRNPPNQGGIFPFWWVSSVRTPYIFPKWNPDWWKVKGKGPLVLLEGFLDFLEGFSDFSGASGASPYSKFRMPKQKLTYNLRSKNIREPRDVSRRPEAKVSATSLGNFALIYCEGYKVQMVQDNRLSSFPSSCHTMATPNLSSAKLMFMMTIQNSLQKVTHHTRNRI